MNRPDPEFLHYFAWGMYDRLFARYRNWRETDDLVHLFAAGARKDVWAVIRPSSNRSGSVLYSNCLPWGAEVRTSIPWKHAARPRRPGSPSTNGDPRQLLVLFAQKAAKSRPPRLIPFRRPALARLAAA